MNKQNSSVATSVKEVLPVSQQIELTSRRVFRDFLGGSCETQQELSNPHPEQQSPPPFYVPTLGDKESNGARTGCTAAGDPGFPIRLFCMLNTVDQQEQHCEELSSVVSWHANGMGFVIHKPDDFVKKILPAFFKTQTRLTSFQRQLNNYGFQRQHIHRHVRVSVSLTYYHSQFLRDKPQLCKNIVLKTKLKKCTSSTDPSTDPFKLNILSQDLELQDLFLLRDRLRCEDRLRNQQHRDILVPGIPHELQGLCSWSSTRSSENNESSVLAYQAAATLICSSGRVLSPTTMLQCQQQQTASGTLNSLTATSALIPTRQKGQQPAATLNSSGSFSTTMPRNQQQHLAAAMLNSQGPFSTTPQRQERHPGGMLNSSGPFSTTMPQCQLQQQPLTAMSIHSAQPLSTVLPQQHQQHPGAMLNSSGPFSATMLQYQQQHLASALMNSSEAFSTTISHRQQSMPGESYLFTFVRLFEDTDETREMTIKAENLDERMTRVVARLQCYPDTEVFCFSRSDHMAIQSGSKKIVFKLPQVHGGAGVTFSKLQFAEMTVLQVLELSPERPMRVEVQTIATIQGRNIDIW